MGMALSFRDDSAGVHVRRRPHRSTTYIVLAHAVLGGDTELYYAPPEGSEVRGFATDGTQMAWLEGRDPPCESGCIHRYLHTDLCVSPYARDPADIDRQCFPAQVTAPPFARVGGGHWAGACREVELPEGTLRKLVIFDLADGRRRIWTHPRWGTSRVLHITDEFVLLYGVWDGQHTILRLELDSIPYEEP
jgi:hypothetical protein